MAGLTAWWTSSSSMSPAPIAKAGVTVTLLPSLLVDAALQHVVALVRSSNTTVALRWKVPAGAVYGDRPGVGCERPGLARLELGGPDVSGGACGAARLVEVHTGDRA